MTGTYLLLAEGLQQVSEVLLPGLQHQALLLRLGQRRVLPVELLLQHRRRRLGVRGPVGGGG